jgi:hypothetical protein
LIYGVWVDGSSVALVAFYLIAFLASLAALLWLVNRHNVLRMTAVH